MSKKEGEADLWLKDDGRFSSGWPRCCRRANIQHTRGPHRPLRGPSWSHDTIFKCPTRGGTSRHLIRAVRPAFPGVFCALLLRLRPGRKDQHGSAEEKATARLKLWNNGGWQIRNIDFTISGSRAGCFVFNPHICHSRVFQRDNFLSWIFFFLPWKPLTLRRNIFDL